MSRSIVIAAAFALTAFAAGAHAADRSVVRLDLKGLDLSSPADAQTAYKMVAAAARQVCNNAGHEVFASDEAERFDRCYSETVDAVVAQSKAPLLAALNGERAAPVRMASR